ncbi:unnamed protein product [Urochloa humidicola]
MPTAMRSRERKVEPHTTSRSSFRRPHWCSGSTMQLPGCSVLSLQDLVKSGGVLQFPAPSHCEANSWGSRSTTRGNLGGRSEELAAD